LEAQEEDNKKKTHIQQAMNLAGFLKDSHGGST